VPIKNGIFENFKFRAYLQGIETIPDKPFGGLLSRFRAYLQGIETWRAEFRAKPLCCFEPTYKELKHGWQVKIEGERESFEPTYKELKLRITVEFFYCFLRFEPTYKELKLP